MNRQPFIESIKNAIHGIFELFLNERNFRIDIFFALLALLFCTITRTRGAELALIILCIALVLGLESLNSALEAAVDLTTQDLHPLARQAKDMAAGAVLIAALLSVAVGYIVFIPKLMLLLQGTVRITDGVVPRIALIVAVLVVYCAWIIVHPLPKTHESKGEMM